MGWLLSALLLALGGILLVLLGLRLHGRLRRTRTAGESLRDALATGGGRLRGGVEELTSWRAARRGTDGPGPGA